jgi:hypothetical protein
VGVASGFSENARNQAREILSRPPFHTRGQSSFHPLAGALHRIGHWLDDLFGPIGRWIEDHLLQPTAHGFKLAFGGWWPYAAGAIAVAAGALAAYLLTKRRARRSAVSSAGGAWHGPQEEDADELEREAAEAERQSELERAIRLRFRAGLVRLEHQGVIEHRDVLTTQQLKRTVNSVTFAGLATDLERIVYGGSTATTESVAAARDGWRRVPDELRASVSGTAR